MDLIILIISAYEVGHKRGVAVLIHNAIHFEFIKQIKDDEGRYILVQCKIEGKLVTLISVYLPPDHDTSVLKKILEIISSETQGVLICTGDFNTILNNNDTSNTKRLVMPQSKLLKQGMNDLGLFDVWREMHPHDREYTFFSPPHKVYSRIDYIFMFSNDRHRISSCEIGTRGLSDHSAVYLRVHLDSRPKKTTWRLNTSLLNNTAFINQIKTEIKDYLEVNDNEEVNPNILWDTLKAVIRGKIIALSSAIKKEKEKHLKELNISLKEMESKHIRTPTNQIWEALKEIRNKISDFYKEEEDKKYKFLKQSYYEIGAKSTKLLARKIRQKQIQYSVCAIVNPESGELENDLEGIDKAFQTYYETLYAQPEQTNSRMVQKI